MQRFDSGGTEIAFDVMGEGAPVLLIHGFASSGRVNWTATGWTKRLLEAGKRIIVIDNRGHGMSEKLYEAHSYETAEMAEDARRLLDHLAIEQCDVMGYSMGARITAMLAIAHPARVRRAVIAGLAESILRGVPNGDVIADGLEAKGIEEISSPVAQAFRKFAEQTGSDLKALAACMRAGRPAIAREALSSISCPVLVVAGEMDEVAGPVAPLLEIIPGAEGLVLPGRDHMKAVGDETYKRSVIEFFSR